MLKVSIGFHNSSLATKSFNYSVIQWLVNEATKERTDYMLEKVLT